MITQDSSEIISLPPALLVGKQVRYSMQKQAEGTNPPLYLLWQECEKAHVFEELERQSDFVSMNAPIGIYCDFNKDGDGCFSYFVGMLMKEGVQIPDGLAVREIPQTEAAVTWFRYASSDDIWSIGPHSITEQFMVEQGYQGLDGDQGWCGEIYPEPTPEGEEILGYLIACEK